MRVLTWNVFGVSGRGLGDFLSDLEAEFNWDVLLLQEFSSAKNVEAYMTGPHKVILASSSPFFEKILRSNKHPHPLIYLRGFQSQDLLSILDFLYFGEANVFQENVDSFLAIAEELRLKGLTGQTASDLVEEEENGTNPKPIHDTKNTLKTTTTYKSDVQNIHYAEEDSKVIAISNQSSSDMQALDGKVNSMMEKSQKLITTGKLANGIPSRQDRAFICKVCGKEGVSNAVGNHIEENHLEGISLQCAKSSLQEIHCHITRVNATKDMRT